MAKEKEQIQDIPVEDKVQAGIRLTAKDVISPEGLLLIESWRRDGCSMVDIAKKIGMSSPGFNQMRRRHPEITEAITRGQEIVDYEVENALLKCALGYRKELTKTYIRYSPDGQGNRETRIEKTIEEVGPNTTACLAWLNNRRPDKWKRNRDNNQDEANENNKSVTINIIKGKEAIEVEEPLEV